MNQKQLRLWRRMLSLVEDYMKAGLPFDLMVIELEGALDASETADLSLTDPWYELWTPLETLRAVYGTGVSREMADQHVERLRGYLTQVLERENKV